MSASSSLSSRLPSPEPASAPPDQPPAQPARWTTCRAEAVVWGTGTVGGHPVAVAVLDFGFMGGSIGALTGELISRAARRALADRRCLVIVCASGGARMQEGAISLMQLARTSQ